MMNKLIYPEANEQLFQSLEGRFCTLFTQDKFLTNVKTASSNSITKEMLEECKPDKDHMLAHFIAVGDYEKFGFNKNADSFPKKANEQYYKTFETNAKFYKEHNSDDPKKAIGSIKKACYNPDMGRIEVAVWINIKKASEAYEKAKAGETLSCSMGAMIPCDRDSINGQLSPNPAKYTPWMKAMPGQYIESWDGKPVRKYAFVHNDNPTFFDLSWVAKPAERIAHYLEYMFNDASDMKKAASINAYTEKHIPFSADIAEEMGLKLASSNVLPLPKQELLNRLVEIEDRVNTVASNKYASKDNLLDQYIFYKSLNANYNTDSDEYAPVAKKLASLKCVRPETLYREFAERSIILPFKSFMDLTYGGTKYASEDTYNNAVKKACDMLPRMFMILKDSMNSIDPEDLGSCSAENVFDCCSAMDAFNDPSKDPVQKFMDEVQEKCSFDDKDVNERVIHIVIKINGNNSVSPSVELTKTATSNDDAAKLAKRYVKEYALYKLAALNDIRTIHGEDFVNDFMLSTVVAQNLVG
jgi:hypothetical protein